MVFDDAPFLSWSLILPGALIFGTLFMGVGVCIDILFDNRLHLSRTSFMLGALAFTGYLFIALLIRHQKNNGGT